MKSRQELADRLQEELAELKNLYQKADPAGLVGIAKTIEHLIEHIEGSIPEETAFMPTLKMQLNIKKIHTAISYLKAPSIDSYMEIIEENKLQRANNVLVESPLIIMLLKSRQELADRLQEEFAELKNLYQKADPAGLEGIAKTIEHLERSISEEKGFMPTLEMQLNIKKIHAAISYLKAPSIDSYMEIIEENKLQRANNVLVNSNLIMLLKSRQKLADRLQEEFAELKKLYKKVDPAGLESIAKTIDQLERSISKEKGFMPALEMQLNIKKIHAAISYLKAPSSIDSYIEIIEENRLRRAKNDLVESHLITLVLKSRQELADRLQEEFAELKNLYQKADPAGLEGIAKTIEQLERSISKEKGFMPALEMPFNIKKIHAAITYLKAPSSIDSYIEIIEENRLQRAENDPVNSNLIIMLKNKLPFPLWNCLEKLGNLKYELEHPKENLPADLVNHASKVYEDCKNRLSKSNLNSAHYKYINSNLNIVTRAVKEPDYKLKSFEAPSSFDALSSLSIFKETHWSPSNKPFELENVKNLIQGMAMMLGGLILTLATGSVGFGLAYPLYEHGEKLMNDACENLGLSIDPIEGMSPK